jgi:hypothetical protein
MRPPRNVLYPPKPSAGQRACAAGVPAKHDFLLDSEVLPLFSNDPAQANERALLTFLLARLRAVDVDVFVGHNFAAFDLDVLLHRLQHHKVSHGFGSW